MARNFSEDGAVGAGQVPSGNFGEGPPAGTSSTLSGFSNDSGTGFAPSVGDVPGVASDGFAQTDSGNHGFFGKMNPAGLSFAAGGAIPDADGDDDGDTDPNATDPQGSALGQSMQTSINAAMQSVQQALSYGRNLHGLGGGQQEAAAMPSVPGSQSESGIPRERPMPGPLPPTSNPFGKRADAGAIDEGDTENAAMPSVPFSESQRPRPTPGPLPPTSNPFGKRGQQADAGSDAAPDQAIDDSEEAA